MRAALLLLLIGIVYAQASLNYLPSQHTSVSVEELINKFADLQSEIYKKVFLHYVIQETSKWRSQNVGEQDILGTLLTLLTDPRGGLYTNLTRFMQERLFKKLEMGTLTQSLQAQIKQNPENFYLTFDIYDLLFD